MGWPWVGEFIGFIIIFVSFATQQKLVNRKHPLSRLSGSSSVQEPPSVSEVLWGKKCNPCRSTPPYHANPRGREKGPWSHIDRESFTEAFVLGAESRPSNPNANHIPNPYPTPVDAMVGSRLLRQAWMQRLGKAFGWFARLGMLLWLGKTLLVQVYRLI